MTNASWLITYELNAIPHNDSRRSRIRWFVIVLLYPKTAMISSIGYTTNAITGNGTPKICAAGWARTLLHDNVLLISQKDGPANSE